MKPDSAEAMHQSPGGQPDAANRRRESRDLDEVSEAEEGAEEGHPEILDSDGDDNPDSSDPFEAHFAHPDDRVVEARLKAIQNG